MVLIPYCDATVLLHFTHPSIPPCLDLLVRNRPNVLSWLHLYIIMRIDKSFETTLAKNQFLATLTSNIFRIMRIIKSKHEIRVHNCISSCVACVVMCHVLAW